MLPQFPTLLRFSPAPNAWAIVGRHLIPIAGVVFLGWSAAVGVTSLFLDGLSALYGLAAVATFFVVRDSLPHTAGWLGACKRAVNALIAFAIVAGLFTFAVGVLYFFAWGYVLGGAGVSLRALAADRTLWWTFAGMLVMQVPHTLSLIRDRSADGAQTIARNEVGFHLFRLAIVILASGALEILPGQAALIAMLVLVQAVRATVEIYGQGLILLLAQKNRPGSLTENARRAESEEPARSQGRSQRRRRS